MIYIFVYFLWLLGLSNYFSVCVLSSALSSSYYFFLLFFLHLSLTLYFFCIFFKGDISIILLDCIAGTLDEFG